MSGPTRNQLESWLSEARLSRYLRIAGDNESVAFQLYLWNTGLAQAVLRDVSFFEVALRNRYAKILNKNLPIGRGTMNWLVDDDSPLRKPIIRTNKRGRDFDANRINRNTLDHLISTLGPGATADDIVANLTFGFWGHMTDRSHERILWIPMLHKAWPEGTDRKVINSKIAAINTIRNRAVHHEHLFFAADTPSITRDVCADCVRLFAQIQPEVADAIYGASLSSSVEYFIRYNPSPCPVNV